MKEVIFLGGGGRENASVAIDNLLVEETRKRGIRKLIYIPLALTSRPYDDCFAWFKSIFGSKVKEIEMWTDLSDRTLSGLERKAALYIGGGNTNRLLRLLNESGFDSKLTNFVSRGGVLYGGSAGAIVLGKDIRTAPEARHESHVRGLDLMGGLSVFCHFSESNRDEVCRLVDVVGGRIIAIPENGGVMLSGGISVAVGGGESYFFDSMGEKKIKQFKIIADPQSYET